MKKDPSPNGSLGSLQYRRALIAALIILGLAQIEARITLVRLNSKGGVK